MLGFTAFRTFARESGPVTPFRVQRPNTARMGRSKTSFGKREREKKREKKREEKQRKKEERKANPGSGDLDSMIAYVDEYGNIVDTPPDPAEREEIDAEDIVLGIPPKEEGDEDPVHTGVVDFFDHQKGFGFINEIGTPQRYFVHITGCEEEIIEGNKVSFELEQGPKGLNAVRVKKV